MSHKAALLADALSVPFNPDKIAEAFDLDRIYMRLACCWARSNEVATVDQCGEDVPTIYSLVGDDVTLAIDFANAILHCETLARLAAKK